MLLLVHVDRMCAKSGKREGDESIGWVNEGKSFAIRDKQHLTSRWLPLFFSQSKFSSFTRKLYRWGFRKIHPGPSGSEKAPVVVFANENFLRDKTELLPNMRSITAAKMRSELLIQAIRPGETDGSRAGNELLQQSQVLTDQAQGVVDTAHHRQQQRHQHAFHQHASLREAGLGVQHHQDTPAASQYLLALSRLPLLSSLPRLVPPQAAGIPEQVRPQFPVQQIRGQISGGMLEQGQAKSERDRQVAVLEDHMQIEKERLAAIAEILFRNRR
jgi:hypothetical protein